MLSTLLFLLTIVIGYLIGSVNSAIIVCRLSNLPDPRSEGSRNPGATNVLRLAGKQYAAIVLLGDMLKGLVPVLIAKMLGAGPIIVGFTSLAAVIGHMYPVFFDFKGGKGVATAMGGLLGFHFILGVTVIATWLIIVNLTRYSSLASIVSMVLAPFYSIFAVGGLSAFLPISFITLLILYKHFDNITRLMDGNEPKIILSSNVPEVATLKTTAQTSKKPVNKKVATKKTPTATKKTSTKKEAVKPATKKTTTKKTSVTTPAKASKEKKSKPKKSPTSKKTS